MILLDPDLQSGPPLKADAARRDAGRGTSQNNLLVPSSRALKGFLVRAQAAVRLRGEVSVLLTTDGTMRRLNRRFRGKDKTTDVLSFPALEPSQVSKSRPGPPAKSQEKIAGDLAISVETAQRQSVTRGHSLETEIRILILHGLLHLNGLDHENDGGEMARREQALRARLGLGQGLIERASLRKGHRAGPHPTPVAHAISAQGRLSTPSAVADSAQDESKDGARSESASQRVSKLAISQARRKNKSAPSLGHPAAKRDSKSRAGQ
jgi:probable rRNA maturation factor